MVAATGGLGSATGVPLKPAAGEVQAASKLNARPNVGSTIRRVFGLLMVSVSPAKYNRGYGLYFNEHGARMLLVARIMPEYF
jgi:hypothetical protein